MRRRVLLPLLLLAACGTKPPAVHFSGPVNTDQVTVGMTLRLTEEGNPKALLRADTAVTPAGMTRSQLKGVNLEFETAGGGQGHLTAKAGEYDPESDLMIARGTVVLVVPGEGGKGTRTIRSEELNWNQTQDRVWSTLETSIEEPGRLLYTQGFTSDSRFTNIQGTNARSGEVQVGEGGVTF